MCSLTYLRGSRIERYSRLHFGQIIQNARFAEPAHPKVTREKFIWVLHLIKTFFPPHEGLSNAASFSIKFSQVYAEEAEKNYGKVQIQHQRAITAVSVRRNQDLSCEHFSLDGNETLHPCSLRCFELCEIILIGLKRRKSVHYPETSWARTSPQALIKHILFGGMHFLSS